MYKLVIFDLDGTILNTLSDLSSSVNYVLKKQNYPLHSQAEIRNYLGNGVLKLIERSLPAASTSEQIDKTYQMFLEYYSKNSMNETIPYDGIIDLLVSLKKKGITAAVVSNKIDSEVQKMCNRYFKGMFKYITGERKGMPKKPDPSLVYDIIQKEKVSIQEVLYVGDSEVDLYTACAANIDCALVTWGFRKKADLVKLNPKYLINTANELLKVISE